MTKQDSDHSAARQIQGECRLDSDLEYASMTPFSHRGGWLIALLFLALTAYHHAPRDNPFAPAFTSPEMA